MVNRRVLSILSEINSKYPAGIILRNGNPDYDLLIDEIAKNEEFNEYEDGIHQFAHFGFTVSHDRLASWLIERSIETTPSQALNELKKYSESKSILIQLIGVIDNYFETSLSEEFHFCNGVILKQDFIDLPLGNETIRSPINMPHCLLEIEFQQFKKSKKNNAPYDKIHQVVNALGLVTPIDLGINLLAIGYFPSQSTVIPMGNIPKGWSMQSSKRTSLIPPLIKHHLLRANHMIEKMNNCNEKVKQLIDVSLKRINEYGFSMNPIDRAIDLRICMESLFLGPDNNDHNQLRYRLALRGARYVSNTIEEREKNFTTLKKAYDLTSTAVHTGKLNKAHDQTILDQAASITRNALIKIIEEGKPVDWLKVELS